MNCWIWKHTIVTLMAKAKAKAKAKDARRKDVEEDAKGQYIRRGHGRENDGVMSVKPRVLPGRTTHNAEAESSDDRSRKGK